MRRLLLLRHGETPWNAEGRWQGRADIELSEAGHLQAKAVPSWHDRPVWRLAAYNRVAIS